MDGRDRRPEWGANLICFRVKGSFFPFLHQVTTTTHVLVVKQYRAIDYTHHQAQKLRSLHSFPALARLCQEIGENNQHCRDLSTACYNCFCSFLFAGSGAQQQFVHQQTGFYLNSVSTGELSLLQPSFFMFILTFSARDDPSLPRTHWHGTALVRKEWPA